MKNFIFLLAASAFFLSCNPLSGNGNVKDEQRDIGGFHSVKTSGSIDVEISSGDSYSVKVENDANLIPYVITEVQSGVLSIHYKEGYSVINDHAKVIIKSPAIDEISTSGSGDVESDGVIKNTNQIVFITAGSGNIDAQVDAPSIKVTASGSGDITLSGRTKNFNCSISGSGDIKCRNLKSENTDIHVSGSSDAHVFASVSLKASISGSGDVYYSGNPPSPEIHTSGSGTVQAEN